VSLSFILFSCTDTSTEPTQENKTFIEGNVGFGLNDSISFEQLIDTIYSFGKVYKIDIVTIQYTTELSKDSLQFIKDHLIAYTFIDSATTLKYDDSKSEWLINFWIFNFRENNIFDWFQLLQDLQLNHKVYSFQVGLLEVEPGKEKYWIDELLKINLFRWVDYNYITHIFFNKF
jgi:hypothetical protein